MASLHKERDTYVIRYRRGPRQFKKTLGKISQTVAKKILRKFNDDLALCKSGIDLPESITLQRLWEEYLPWVKTNQASKTYGSKRLSYSTFLRFLAHPSIRLNPEILEVQEIGMRLIDRYKTFRQEEGVCNRTINIELNFLSNLLKMARTWNYIAPHFVITKLKLALKPPRFLSEEEIRKLLNGLSPYTEQFVILLLHTGLRVGELLNLQWQDIDWERKIIKVTNTATFKTKNQRDRFIPINGLLEKHLLFMKEMFVEPFSGRYLPRQDFQRNYVICGEKGERIKCVQKSFYNLLEGTGLKGVSLHTLRHTFASHFVMNGGDIVTLKELLGHTNIQTTMVYAHLSDQHKKKAMEMMGSVSYMLPLEKTNIGEKISC